MKYRSEIDGLRAVAVLSVIFCHVGVPYFSGGYVGVDVFFVISGYLITKIIRDQLDARTFSLARFYERRARRILPALFAMLVPATIYAWFSLIPRSFMDFAKGLATTSAFSSNFYFWHSTNYFAANAHMRPLLHTWSLAVEEQFYLLFPAAFALLYRRSTRLTKGLITSSLILSLLLAQWASRAHPTFGFYLLPTRAWELAMGSLIGVTHPFLQNRTPRILGPILSAAGLVLIMASIAFYTDQTPFPGFLALAPTVGTSLVILFGSPHGFPGILLSNKVSVGIGLVSYSAYLWHQPLLAFARHTQVSEPGALESFGLVLLTLLLAYLSWKLVEQPFRRPGAVGRKQVLLFSVLGSTILVGTGLAIVLEKGLPSRPALRRFYVASYEPDNRALQEESWRPLRALSGNVGYGVSDNRFDRLPWFESSDPRPRVLLVGNSHSKDLYNVMLNSESARENFQLARFGAQIAELPGETSDFFRAPNYLDADAVVLVTRFGRDDLEQLPGLVERFEADGKLVVLVRDMFHFHFEDERNTADVLLQGGLLDEIRDGRESTAQAVEKIDDAYRSEFESGRREWRHSGANLTIDRLKSRFPDVLILDRMDYACADLAGTCFAIDDELEKFYYDYGHHTLAGAAFFGRRVDLVGWLGALEEKLDLRDRPPGPQTGTEPGE